MCFSVLTHSRDNMECSLGIAFLYQSLIAQGRNKFPLLSSWMGEWLNPKTNSLFPVQLSKITIRKPWNIWVGQKKSQQGKNRVKQNQIWFVGPLPKLCCCTEQDCSGDLGVSRCLLIAASDVTLVWGTKPSFAEISVPWEGYLIMCCHIS